MRYKLAYKGVYCVYISWFKLSLLFETFPEKYKKKVVTHFWHTSQNKNLKVKKTNCPRNDQLLPEPKGRNQNKILNYEKGLKTANISLIISNIFFRRPVVLAQSHFWPLNIFLFFWNHIVRTRNFVAVDNFFSDQIFIHKLKSYL